MADNSTSFPSIINPNAARTGLWDMRMMSAANRMETPFERRAGGGGRGLSALSGLGGMQDQPDYSSFTFNPAQRQQAIEAGVTPLDPSQVRQNTFLPNTGFFGSHPRLSAALESGLLGAASTRQSQTTGEGISNAIGGALEGIQTRQSMYRKQFEAPFQASDVLENLQDKKQKRMLQEADIQHLRAVNQHLEEGDYDKAQQLAETNRHNEAVEAERTNQTNATAPRNLGGGLYGTYNPGGKGPNQRGNWNIEENWDAKTGRAASAAANAGPWYSYTNAAGQQVYDRVSKGQIIPKGAQLVQGDYQQKKEDKNEDKRLAFINKKRDPSEYRAILGNNWRKMSPDDIAKGIGNYYDKNQSHDYVYDPEAGLVPTH